MTQRSDMGGAQLYTLRVWCHAGRWRAVVRAVGEDHTQLFTEPAPLAHWLLQPANPPPDAPTPSPEIPT